MKPSDSTKTFVYLELVVGVIFLLLIVGAATLLSERADSLSSSFSTSTDSSDVDTAAMLSLQKNGGDTATVEVLQAMEKRVDTLFDQRKDLSVSAMLESPDAIEQLLDKHMQQIYDRFTGLEASFDSRTDNHNGPAVKQLQELGDNIETMLTTHRAYLDKTFAALNAKIDAQKSLQETTVVPALKLLNDKVDLLLLERDKQQNAALTRQIPVAKIVMPSAPPTPVAAKQAVQPLPQPTPTAVVQYADGADAENNLTGDNSKVLLAVQEIINKNQIVSKIDRQHGTILLPIVYDYARGSSILDAKQLQHVARLADVLAEILPCYAKSSVMHIVGQCPAGSREAGLEGIVINSFSVGGNVGTTRINYNSKLANARSVFFLKSLVSARPDLLDFVNMDGNALFDAVGKLAAVGDKRSRRTMINLQVAAN